MKICAVTRLKASLPTGNISAQDCLAAIGQTKFNAVTKHEWYKHWCYLPSVHATVFKLSTSNTGQLIVAASYDGLTQVQFYFYRNKVINAGLFRHKGGKTFDGAKLWEWIRNYRDDDED